MVSAPDGGAAHTPELRIGTSGWSYAHWRGVFYPEHLPVSERLAFYATRFATVEVDATFYRLPSADTVARWRDAVPQDFLFAVKGSRFITHFRKLAGTADQERAFLQRMSLLGPKLAVVLWQLPPTLQRDDRLLEEFVQRLPSDGPRHAVEFRHESWLGDGVLDLLRRHGVAMVSVSGDMLRADLTPTTDFVYARFHGTARYHGSYERPALHPWAAFLRERLAEGSDCFAYFNNDFEGHAPADAARLAVMLEER